jgi:hypothetical protein
MPVAEYFSIDYASARDAFRSAAESARAALQSFQLPDRSGPRGEPLTIDVALLGAREADRGLVIISGTHGVEGFCGSGCQVGFLVDRLYEALPKSTCCVLVHALNPYGFAWLRRVNEDGVDLNRNFVDFSRQLPSSASYEALHDWLVPTDWDGKAREEADAKLKEFADQHGMAVFQAAISGGQYTRPAGLFYGGDRPSWSARTLRAILEQHLAPTVRHVAVLDLHTGLGPTAYGEPILIARSKADAARARQWYGADVRDLSGGESVSAQVVGSVAQGIEAALPQKELTYVALEFGTRPILEVLTALRADHWWHAYGSGEVAARIPVQRHMRDAFYSETPPWQAAVYGRTADFVFRACRGLASSG